MNTTEITEAPATERQEGAAARGGVPERPAEARPKVGFVSLGCPKNLVDSEVMMGMLNQAGAEMTATAEDADILVVNTCSFIDSAKQESVDTILEMAQHKTSGRAKRLVVAGCMVERYRDEIRRNIPEVDAVVGTGELDEILTAAGLQRQAAQEPGESDPASLFRILTSREAAAAAMDPAALPLRSRPEGDRREQQGRFSREGWDGANAVLPRYLYNEMTPRLLATGKTSAYIKIAEGCDHPCGFCIIPQLRGKFRSRGFESVVAEAERLARQGVREITLIGQDTTCYGDDLGLKDGLALLLDRLARIEGLKWLRFLYAYPNRITGKLLDTIAQHDTICKYLDVPLQHASPQVLKRMKRGGGADVFLKTLERARASVPGLTLRTAFIAGYPGETAADVELLEQFIREVQFDWLGVFSYSDEEGSKSFALDGKVTKRTIEARRRRLMRVQQAISRNRKRELVGRTFDLLAEGEAEETPLLWEGRTVMHAPQIDGKVYIADPGEHEALAAGSFYRCEVTDTHDYDLVVRIIE